MAELQAMVGEEWVRTYEHELTPEALAAALKWARTERTGPAPRLEELEWSRIARQTLSVYAGLLRERRGADPRSEGPVVTLPQPPGSTPLR